MQDLENITYNFLKNNCKVNAHYGIGYSGGSDSKALLYLLVKSLASMPLNLHVLHVDHAWRAESKKEADLLEAEVKAMGLSFHRHTLEKNETKSNMEDQARNERLLFFSNISQKLKLEGVFLAHHADDLAETVLKRVLEGAQLENMIGMKPISCYLATNFFRPLLRQEKTAIKAFLDDNKLSVIDDPTNHDQRFLRAKMRESLFPLIEKNFGKSIKNNLIQLSFRSQLLHSYLDENLKEISIPSIEGPMGCSYDFCISSQLHLIERNYLLKKIFNKEGLDVGRDVFAKIQNHLELKNANKKFIFKKMTIICDRGVIFFLKNYKITPKNQTFSIHKNSDLIKPKIGWRSFWKGEFYCPIPNEDIDIKWFDDLNRENKKRLLDRWEKKKVPAFLRRKAPILCQNGKIIQDLLNSEITLESIPTCFFEWKIRLCDLIS